MRVFILVVFVLSTLRASSQKADDFPNGEIDKQAEYPGGLNELYKFIHQFLCYPESMEKDKLEAKIYVEFTIDTTGKVINPKIKRGFNQEVDNICLGVFEFMPDWIPASGKGKKVKQKFVIPFNFMLKGSKYQTEVITPLTCAELENKKSELRNKNKR